MSDVIRTVFIIYTLMYVLPVFALPFGTFDPRSVAMGGTGVASGTAANASFYNPALLARYEEYKEEADNQRFIYPTVNIHASDVIYEAEDFNEQGDDELITAINAYNAAPNDPVAQNNVLQASRSLSADLNRVSETPFYLDANVGFVIGIPTKGQGGAFMYNRRLVGDGKANFSESDKQVVNAFIDTMEAITSNGASGQIHPEIFINNDPNNDLDPALIDQLTSDAAARAADITELGMSMSWEVNWFNTEFSFGFTPKGMRVSTYDVVANAADTNFSDYEVVDHDWDFNMDFGLAKDFTRQLTMGVVIKNIFSKKYSTSLGNAVVIEPLVRLGAAYYTSSYGTYAVDLDITENQPIGSGGNTRLLGLGGEWDLRWGIVRAGYKKDLGDDPVSDNGLLSGGLRLTAAGFFCDLTYAQSSKEEAAAIQLGLQF